MDKKQQELEESLRAICDTAETAGMPLTDIAEVVGTLSSELDDRAATGGDDPSEAG
jgi:hypothetical protein